MTENRTVTDLLLELQALDRVKRSGYVLRGVPEGESVAEHCFQLAMVVWCLGAEVAGLDLCRAVELALLHDVAEVRFGDLPRTAAHYLPPGAKKAAEAAAARDLLHPLGARSEEILDEYRSGTSLEARFVRTCDRLQLLIKVSVYEDWGVGALDEFWDEPELFDDGGFAPVRRVLDELSERRDRRDGR